MKSITSQLALIFGLACFATFVLVVLSIRNTAIDDLLQKYTTPKVSSSIDVLNINAPKSQWDNSTRYLVYLPFEGISNQFYSFQNAAAIAKRLNRTLVVPPITSNRHDRLGTSQPWSHYMDLEHMSVHAGVKTVEWHDIKRIDYASRQIIEIGSRRNKPKAWKKIAEKLPCQVVRGYGHDYLVGEEDSIGADFAYQYLLDIDPVPMPGIPPGEEAAFVGDIVDFNQNSTDQVICLTYTFTAQFELGRNRWDISWNETGQYLRFLPRFASYVEDIIAYHAGFWKSRNFPNPPINLGSSILDRGSKSETFLSRKPVLNDYIAIHLRRGDIEIKCANRTIKDCVVPLTEYKKHVDAILKSLPQNVVPPKVVLVSDTQSDKDKKEIERYGWYRLDHAMNPDLLDASKVLGPFSPALIDSAVLTGRGARWVIGSRRSTMSWLAAMRLSSWFNNTIIYPKQSAQQISEGGTEVELMKTKSGGGVSAGTKRSWIETEDDSITTWDRHEQHFFDNL
ncbi:hypothetical protein BGZ76_001683 [Entomortierella beljakovae]|nr:hypothetical protein BGZ76_001683 [Entomortierella beljakovae]